MAKHMNKVSVSLKENLTSFLSQNEADMVLSAWSSFASSKKKKKDKDAPKKAKSSYIFYCMDKRAELKNKDPSLSANQLTTKLGQMWKELSEKDKKKYEDLAKKDKERYSGEMSQYTPPPTSDDDATPSKKKKREQTGPKRPMSAYLYFCKDMREVLKKEKPELKANEATSEIGARWKALSEEQKKPYEARHLVDKQRYEAEKGGCCDGTAECKADAKKESKADSKKVDAKKAESKKPEAKKPEAKTEVKKAEPKKPEVKKAGTDKAPPASKKNDAVGFKAFCEDKKEDLEAENPDWNARKVNSELNKMWKELPKEDKEAYALEEGGDSDVDELEDE